MTVDGPKDWPCMAGVGPKDKPCMAGVDGAGAVERLVTVLANGFPPAI